jgi:hypothetical protein
MTFEMKRGRGAAGDERDETRANLPFKVPYEL